MKRVILTLSALLLGAAGPAEAGVILQSATVGSPQSGGFVVDGDQFLAARFHLVVLISIVGAALWGITGVDPVKVTEYSIVLSAAALPLTYFPILVIANDPAYMDEHTNGRILNILATIFLVILVVVSVATIPLMIITKAGQ